MRKIKIILEYDGRGYCGWQIQPNGISIQETVENAIKKIVKEKTSVIVSGRTDAGVHAEAQVAHFKTKSKMTTFQFLKAMNSVLPNDIVIKNVCEVPPSFHARRSSIKKVYRYSILNREFPSALNFRRVWYISTPLNVEAMQIASKTLEGKHDFSSFRASGCGSKSPIKHIFKIRFDAKKSLLDIFFEGSGFLKYMIRNIIGTFILIGKNQISPKELKKILDAKNRNLAGPTAPPQGLCLISVNYPENFH